LILTPTRELAMQVADHARELAANTHLDIATITGGVAYMNHAEVFSENQDIVVATTGRLLQYIKEENFDCRAVETLILDEADRMLDMGFAQDIEHIAGETRWRNQTMLFSATLEGKRLKTSQSVCWKIRWKSLRRRPPVSVRRSTSGTTARTTLSTRSNC
jgi:ATP-dependent RNA helicase SrmB